MHSAILQLCAKQFRYELECVNRVNASNAGYNGPVLGFLAAKRGQLDSPAGRLYRNFINIAADSWSQFIKFFAIMLIEYNQF